MKPLVSILIPAYNTEQFIADAIKSALAQTWDNKEIIVIDDGSTDQTLSVANEFKSAGVTVVRQENQGAAAARNHALALSKGDYIQWLDADDLLSNNKVEAQLAALRRPEDSRFLLSGPWSHFHFRPNRAEFVKNSLWDDLSPVEWLRRKLSENLHMQTATWLVSRELTLAAGPWDTRLQSDDDGEYFCRMILLSQGTRFVPEARVYYRVSGTGSLSYLGYSEKKLISQAIAMKLHIKYLRSHDDSPAVRQACLTYLQNWLMHFYPERQEIVSDFERLAIELGGRLKKPKLRPKYAWLRPLIGFRAAKRSQLLLPVMKSKAIHHWEHLMFNIEGADRSSPMVSRDINQP